MTSPESDDAARSDLPGRPDDPARAAGSADARRFDLPDDVDAAFAAIVAGWGDDGATAPRWPDDPTAPDSQLASGIGLATPPQGWPTTHPERTDELGPDLLPPAPRGESTPTVPTTPPVPHRPATGPGPDSAAGDHFVPPEPPPLPKIGLSSLAGLLLLVGGVVLLALPALVGGVAGLGIVPGLLAMTAGLGWLVVGMRRPSESDDDHRPDTHGEV